MANTAFDKFLGTIVSHDHGSTGAAGMPAGTRIYIVDPGGNGDFTTITAAINACDGTNKAFIFINGATYAETDIPLKSNITLFGAGVTKVTVGSGATTSATFTNETAPVTNVEFHNMVINMGGGGWYSAFRNLNNSSIYLYNCIVGQTSTAANNLTFYNSTSNGIGSTGVQYGGQTGTPGGGAYYNALITGTSAGWDATCINCRFTTATFKAANNFNGINCVFNAVTYDNASNTGTNVFKNCTMTNFTLAPTPGYAYELYNCTVSGTLTLPTVTGRANIYGGFIGTVANSQYGNFIGPYDTRIYQDDEPMSYNNESVYR